MSIPPDLEVNMTDYTKAGLRPCMEARRWFREHGLYDEFRTLTSGGTIPAGKLLETGDADALRVVDQAVKRHG